MSSEYIKSLSLNPFFCSKIIPHFVQGYGKDVELPLAYLILPYVLYEPSRNVLRNANAKSSIYSLFIDNNKLLNIAGIEKRYEIYKNLTNQSIIVACNENLLEFEQKLKLVGSPKYQNTKNLQIREYYKAAYYLGRIFSDYRPFDIFLKIGVKEV
ncbi:three component ABC system middle component [Bacillus sp. FJAT-29814]|uniref:three component ABC system middle component n=1 Tax=Bacillus sp. FJAT-29814 TaxID=1729688 RepID=UPI00082F0A0C|nr:three component ABC system middle component [Bacillus sp. FJAT-29814]